MDSLRMETRPDTAATGRLVEPMERPDMERTVVIDLMGEGSVIEKDPVPVASIVASGASAEAILERTAELSEARDTAEEDGQTSARFVPYALTGEPEEIWGGITILGESPESTEAANDLIMRLIGSVERPSELGEESTEEDPVSEELDDTDEKEPGATEALSDKRETGRGKAALLTLALRRGRLGKAAAAAAFVAGGALSWVSSASAETLEQTCVKAGMKPMRIKHARVRGVHRHNGNGWYVRANGYINAMPDVCAENGIHRVLNQRGQLQNGRHRAQWIMVSPWYGSIWNGHRNNRGTIEDDAIYGAGLGFSNSSYQHNHNWTNFRYICTPGPKKTDWRFQTMNTVIRTDGNINEYGDNINGKIQVLADPKITNHRMKVYGAC